MTPPNTELAEAIDNIKDMSGTYCHLNAKDIRDVQTILKAARSTLTRPPLDLAGMKNEADVLYEKWVNGELAPNDDFHQVLFDHLQAIRPDLFGGKE